MSNDHRPRGWRPRAFLAAACAGAMALGTVTAGAAPPSDDPPVAATYGAAWLADQVAADGSVAGGFDPLGDAGATALALAAAGVEVDAYERALGYVVGNAESFVAPFGTDDAGRLGRALLLAEVGGIDPTAFGGVDLVARLEATLGDFAPGLYGASDPTYDGVLRQSLAVLGLVAVGEPPAGAAVDWLVDQQCDGATPAAEGGWQSYRADTGVPCAAPDADLFAGPDSNATGYAMMALAAVGESPTFDAVDYLGSVQSPDGGWSYQGSAAGEPNSTGIVIQALLAVGEDPSFGGPDPYDSLLAWAIPCGEEHAGAFVSPYSDGAPNVIASLDAIPAAAGVAWPLAGPVTLTGEVTVDCDGTSGSTTSTTSTTVVDGEGSSTTSTTTGRAPTTPPPAAAQPVAAQFTG